MATKQLQRHLQSLEGRGKSVENQTHDKGQLEGKREKRRQNDAHKHD